MSGYISAKEMPSKPQKGAAGGPINGYNVERRLASWRATPEGRIFLLVLLFYIRKQATDDQILREKFAACGITAKGAYNNLIRCCPGVKDWYKNCTGKELTPRIVYGRIDMWFRKIGDPTGGRLRAKSREHPDNWKDDCAQYEFEYQVAQKLFEKGENL